MKILLLLNLILLTSCGVPGFPPPRRSADLSSLRAGTGEADRNVCATCVAVRLPEAAGAAARLWGNANKLWPQRATLKVQFLDGTASQQRRAWHRFQCVDKLVNLTFVKAAAGEPGDIRVAFDPAEGHWSYVGTDNRRVTGSTMNLALGAWDNSAEWTRVATHEVLHAIGCNHEHQHPQAGIPWNVPVVLRDYARTQGWSEAQTRYQVLDRRDAPDFFGSAWDKKSIMQYPVPREHVLDPAYAVGWNRKLTETDKATLRRVYP